MPVAVSAIRHGEAGIPRRSSCQDIGTVPHWVKPTRSCRTTSVCNNELHITLAPLSSPHRTRAVQACSQRGARHRTR